MIKSNPLGAIAANIAALCFLCGFALALTLLAGADYPNLSQDPLSQVQFMQQHSSTLQAWYLLIYLLFGLCLLVLATVLHQQLQSQDKVLAQITLSLGLLWAGLVIATGMLAQVGMAQILTVYARDPQQAQNLWLTLQLLIEGLGGGNEIVGGLWLLMSNLLGIKTRLIPRWLGYIGLITSLAGLLTLIPGLEIMAALFGLGCIVWFATISIQLLNQAHPG